MNNIKSFYTLLIAAFTIVTMVGCSDSIDNEFDSQLIEENGYQISKFTLDKTYWNIPEDITSMTIFMKSESSDLALKFFTVINHLADKKQYGMRIPLSRRIPDGNYSMRAMLPNGDLLPMVLHVTFRDQKLQARNMDFMNDELSGAGTKENPYLIEDNEDFETLRYYLSCDTVNHAKGLYFLQTADVDVKGNSVGYDGTMYTAYSFAGHYDGGGHTVSYSYIGDNSGEANDIGLFANLVDGAEIQNLIVDAKIKNGNKNVGLLAGNSQGNVYLNNVEAKGSVEAKDNVGGFIGYAEGNLTVENSKLNRLDIEGNNYVGGVVGCMSNDPDNKGMLTVKDFSNLLGNSESTYLVTIDANGYVGGIAGNVDKSGVSLTNITLKHSIDKSQSNMDIFTASSNRVGGLIGALSAEKESVMDNCCILLPIRTEGNEIGGLVGYTSSQEKLKIRDCQSSSVVNGNEYVGGFIGKVYSHGKLCLEGNNKVNQEGSAFHEVKGNKYVGGMIGFIEGDIVHDNNIENRINVDVKAFNNFGGGIAGGTEKCTIYANYFSMSNNMKVMGNDAIGGLVGYANHSTIKGRVPSKIDFSSVPKTDDFKEKSDYPGIVDFNMDETGYEAKAGTSIGGIVGYAKNTYIQNLCVTGSVQGKARVGGIVGHLDNPDRGIVEYCVSIASTLMNNYGDDTGGLIGLCRTKGMTLKYLLNYANVNGVDYTGGVIGRISLSNRANFIIEYMLNKGNVNGGNLVSGGVSYIQRSDSDDDDDYRGWDVIIQHSSNFGTIKSDSKNSDAEGAAGGVLGHGNVSRMRVLHCSNHGQVSSTKEAWVGGVAGCVGHDKGELPLGENMEMAYCCNRGVVYSDHEDSRIGGVLGYQRNGSYEDEDYWMTHDCYNKGNVKNKKQSHTNGGILGHIAIYGEIERCYNDGIIKDLNDSNNEGNGVVGDHHSFWSHENLFLIEGKGKSWKAEVIKESDKSNSSKYTGFDFNKYWRIDKNKNDGTPYLVDCQFQFGE